MSARTPGAMRRSNSVMGSCATGHATLSVITVAAGICLPLALPRCTAFASGQPWTFRAAISPRDAQQGPGLCASFASGPGGWGRVDRRGGWGSIGDGGSTGAGRRFTFAHVAGALAGSWNRWALRHGHACQGAGGPVAGAARAPHRFAGGSLLARQATADSAPEEVPLLSFGCAPLGTAMLRALAAPPTRRGRCRGPPLNARPFARRGQAYFGHPVRGHPRRCLVLWCRIRIRNLNPKPEPEPSTPSGQWSAAPRTKHFVRKRSAPCAGPR